VGNVPAEIVGNVPAEIVGRATAVRFAVR